MTSKKIRTAALLFSLLTLSSCSADSNTTSTAPTDIRFDTMSVTVNKTPLTLEIADTDAKRERGLMYRESMPQNHGMIFIFETADKYAFWMKNTEIPLDIVFLDSTGKILAIHHRKPHDETAQGPDSPALFAIELNDGAAAGLNLKEGDTFPLPDKLLKPASHTDEK